VRRYGTTTTTAVPQEMIDGLLNSSVGDRVRITSIRQVKGTKASRAYYTVRGDRGAHWDIPNNDMDSVMHAMFERVYFVKKGGKFSRPTRPTSEESVFKTLKDYTNLMATAARHHGKVPPVTAEQFLSRYGGAKLRLNTSAITSLIVRSIEKRDGYVRLNTKDEYRAMKDGIGKPPRAIQPRSPRFNVSFGRYTTAVEEHTYRSINLIFDPTGAHRTVAKGMNMLDRGETIAEMWKSFSNPVAVGLDASRFDQHVCKAMLKWEHGIYLLWLDTNASDRGDLASFKELAAMQLVNNGRYYGTDGKVKYVVNGCRMSGDMNTSLGNINIMCALMWTYIRHVSLLGKVKLLNDGDDCVLIMEHHNLKRFTGSVSTWFESMGFTMTFDGIYTSLEKIEFCQARPVKLLAGWTLIPRPSKRLYSDLVSTKPIHSKKVYNAWLGSVAGCGIAASAGVPLFNSFYKWLGRGATPYMPTEGSVYYRYRMELTSGMKMKSRDPTWDERISFYFAFDITPASQLLLEKYFDELPDPVHGVAENNVIQCLDGIQHLCPPEQADRPLC
jgi:hypothetical protein